MHFTSTIPRTVLISCLLLSLSVGVHAANYYVKTTGNDASNGTSYATAFRTIQKALNVASGASTIYVDAGTYKERLFWPNSGASASNLLTLTNYNGGLVYLDGGSGGTNSGQNALIAINSKSNILITNISFRNNYRIDASGIYIVGSGSNVKISNCKLFNIGWTTNASAIPNSGQNCNPLLVVGSKGTPYSDIYIGNCEIYNCITGYSEALTLNGNINNFLLENNRVHDNTNIGIDIAGHYSWTGAPASVNQARNGIVKNNIVYNCVSQVATSAGIYVDGGKWITIEGNKVYGNGAGLSLGCENNNKTAESITVRNNFIYNNREAGIYFGSSAPNSRVQFCTLSNNTFYRNYTVGGFGVEIAMQNSANNTISNNILVPRDNDDAAIGVYGYTATGLTIKYNLFWRTTSDKTGNMFGNISGAQNSVFENPLVVSGTNLHIQAGSKAINAGDPNFTPAAGETDIDGQNRKQAGRVDIGADETSLSAARSELATLNPDVSMLALSSVPNPCIGYIPVTTQAHLTLLDMNGRTVRTGYFQAGSQMDVRTLPAGVYMLKNTSGQAFIRLVIQKE